MGKTIVEEQVTWVNEWPWIDNVLANVNDYLIHNRDRGGDDLRYHRMLALKKAAIQAKNSHNVQAVKILAAKLRDKGGITPYGVWGSWGKASFSYKILAAMIEKPFHENEIQAMAKPIFDEKSGESKQILEKWQAKLATAKTEAEKTKILEEIMQTQASLLGQLEGKLRTLSTTNDGLENRITRLNLELNDSRSITATEKADNDRLRKENGLYHELQREKEKIALQLANREEEVKSIKIKMAQELTAKELAIKELQTKFTALEKERNTLASKLAEVIGERDVLKANQDTINKTGEAFRKDEKFLQAMQEELRQARARLVKEQDNIDALKLKITELTKSLDEASKQIAELIKQAEKTKEAHSATLQIFSNEKKRAEEETSELRHQMTQVKEFIGSLFILIKQMLGFMVGEQHQEFAEAITQLETSNPLSESPKKTSGTLPSQQKKKAKPPVEIQSAPTTPPAKQALPSAVTLSNTAAQTGSPIITTPLNKSWAGYLTVDGITAAAKDLTSLVSKKP